MLGYEEVGLSMDICSRLPHSVLRDYEPSDGPSFQALLEMEMER